MSVAAVRATKDEQLAFKKKAGVAGLPEQITNTDMANAARLARRHGKDIRYTQCGWMVYRNGHWTDDPVLIQELAKETALSIFDEIKDAPNPTEMFLHAKQSQSRRSIEAQICLARSESGVPASITDFDSDHMSLNVANGIIDLRTGNLREHDRDELHSKIVPIVFDQNADCVRWDAFIQRITGRNQELYSYLRRFVGYLLTGMTGEQVLHFLFGLGANGKSVFCEVVTELLGNYAIIASPEMVMARRHSGIPNDIARLRGTRAAFMNETSQGARFDEAKLKDLTGSDKQSGRFLHQEFFDFLPTHKLVIRGNHKPSISGTDEGIWRRLRLVPFGVEIPPEEQDRTLLEKLRDELPGILLWAVHGCLEWQKQGLNPPAIVVDAVKSYRQDSDTLGRFIDEHCEKRPNASVRSSTLFHHYQRFAEKSGELWLSNKDLPTEMERRGFQYKKTAVGRLFYGLELKSSDADGRQE